jgi:rhomboid protease GluP
MGLTYTTLDPRTCPQCGLPMPPGEKVCLCGYSRENDPHGDGCIAEVTKGQQSHRRTPQVTYFLIAFNVAIFILMTLAGGSTRIETLLNFGAMYRPLFTGGEYWRLITPIFLHIGILHLAFNMYALFVLGSVAEQIYGSTRFFWLYLLSGVGGTVSSSFFSTGVSAGASGAIFGISGIALMVGYLHLHDISTNFRNAVGRGIIPFVVFNLVYGFSNKGIDNSAHLGGLLTGSLLAFVVRPRRADKSWEHSGLLSFGNLLPLVVILGAFFFPFRSHLEMRKVEADFRQALQLEKAGKYDETITAYQRALKRRPDLSAVHNNLAVVYARQQRFEMAEQEARAAVRLGEGTAMYHQTLGSILWQRNNIAEAVSQYRRAIELDSSNLEFHKALGELYAEQGRWQEAVSEWEAVQKQRPQDATIREHIEALRRNLAFPNTTR